MKLQKGYGVNNYVSMDSINTRILIDIKDSVVNVSMTVHYLAILSTFYCQQ